ncbi:amidase [Bacillaceae bacterium]
MSVDRPLYDLSVAEAARYIREKKISPVELTQALLERIADVEGKVQAWVALLPEKALADAKKAEEAIMRQEKLGPLHGIPFGAKDIYYTKGIKTSAGSKVDPDFVPYVDATVITKLKQAGAILLGKTTTTEYALLGGPPPTRNPWHLCHTPGGSSSGSAAALAASMALFTLGTQTAGSLCRPAAFNGLVALKATYGRISRAGIIPVSWSLDHAGAFTRSVEDAAILLQVLSGPDRQDLSTLHAPSAPDYLQALDGNVKGMTIGVLKDDYFGDIDEEYARRIDETIAVFQSLGVRFVSVTVPFSLDDALIAHNVIMKAEAAAYHEDRFKVARERYGPSLQKDLEFGRKISAVDYLRAQRIRNVFQRQLNRLFAQVDALLTPTALGAAPQGIHSTGNPKYNIPFTLVGVPALTIPIGVTKDEGLPLGVQLAARPWHEKTLIRLGDAFQRATSFHRMRPSL